MLASLVPLILVAVTPAGVEQRPDSTPAEQRWYGAPGVVAEGAAVGLIIVGGIMTNQPGQTTPAMGKDLIGLGIASWALGPPINHAAHGHGTKALGSLGL